MASAFLRDHEEALGTEIQWRELPKESWHLLFGSCFKALTNILGMGVAASGYALGKAMTSVQNTFTSDPDGAVVADSMIFQMAFSTWHLGLHCR